MFKIKSSCLLLLVVALPNLISTQEGDTISRNSSSSQLFDSINEDLDKIKEQIEKTLKTNRTVSPYEFKSNDLDEDILADDSHSHYVEDFAKDRPFMRCSTPNDPSDKGIFKFSIPYLNKSLGMLNFEEFRGKVLLLVNVATFCESTIEYPMYNQLVEKYGNDLVIVGFPCAQFENQEPTSDYVEIYNAIKYVRPGNGFIPKFPLTERIKVNGEDQHPIFAFLKQCCPSTRTRFSSNEHKLLYKPKNSRDIRWNFEKFLIDPNTGFPIKRYDQKYLPDRIAGDIDKVLLKLKNKNEVPNVPKLPSETSTSESILNRRRRRK